MASPPDHEFDNDGALILTGSANAYVAATARKIKGYYEGLRICARANHTNTGAATITVDEAGSVAIRKAGNVALIGGEIINGGYYDFIYDAANNVMQVGTASQLGAFTSGPLVIGHTAQVSTEVGNASITPTFQILGTGSQTSQLIARYSTGGPPRAAFARSRNTTTGQHTVVQVGDQLGIHTWAGSDGTNFAEGANIEAVVASTPGAGDMPTDLIFRVSPDGAETPTEVYRITFDQTLKAAGQGYFAGATLTDAATVDWNLTTQQCATLTLGGNRTLAAPTNMKNGATYILLIKQDGTGSRTLAWNAAYTFQGGTDPVLSTGANAVDLLTCYSDGTSMYCSLAKAFA